MRICAHIHRALSANSPCEIYLVHMMYENDFGSDVMTGYAFNLPFFDPTWFVIFLLWTIVWKGIALWYSAQREDKLWFIALLIINTAGILEIFYLFVIAKKKFTDLFPIGDIK